MTLREQLMKTRLMVKIGAINGGGYFFIGRPKDMLDNAQEYDQMRLERLENRIKKCEYEGKWRDSKKWSARREWMERYKVEALPLLDREVREVCRSVVDIAICIIVDGNEIGGYWMLSEAKESPVNFKGVMTKVDYGQI